ncbi:MAG: HAD family hydrolase [Candidatus Natronoplasma sp.]
MKGKLAIFDLDGTLYKTEEVSVPALKRSFSKFGIELTEEQILGQFGEPTEQIIKNLTPESKIHLKDEIEEEIAKNESALIPSRGTLYQGVKEMLEELDKMGYDLTICSNGRDDYIRTVLKTTSIDEYFSAVKSYTDGKSKSDMIEELLEEYSPKTAVMIGDRYHDIQAAKEVGIPSIGAGYGYGGEEMRKADHVVSRASEIPPLFEEKIS